ncbi:MAG: nucleotidyltransferase family protein [Ruminococcus sp.]|nr:nucleotidyltransferase family protein [Ruminococcus sp.]
MPTGALICEYNPFHNGHKYMLSKMREDGCDAIVAVMSGSFTQRGDVAVCSKFSRAKEALRNGADLVIELPCVWAVASAERFARGGCEIIKAAGCVDRVYFGSECGDIQMLKAAADATNSTEVNEKLQSLMAQGEYYPKALQKAVEDVFGRELADVLSSPNNTLGIEYIKALTDSDTQLRTIKRTGVDHHSTHTTDTIASASKIRDMIKNEEDFSAFIPKDLEENNPAFLEYGERALLYMLRKFEIEDIKAIPDVSEGLENRILSAAKTHNSIEKILDEIKTKRYTHSRLRRILTCALLGIRKEHHAQAVPYIRVLGFNSRAEQLLKELNKSSALPLVLNVAKDKEKLSETAAEILSIDIKATDLRTVFEKSPSPCGADFTRGIIKV